MFYNVKTFTVTLGTKMFLHSTLASKHKDLLLHSYLKTAVGIFGIFFSSQMTTSGKISVHYQYLRVSLNFTLKNINF